MFEWEDLAYAPGGGRPRQILVGLTLALALAGYAAWCLVRGEALLPSRNEADVLIHGEPARWMGIFYLGIALFMHFHWFWGLVPAWRISQTGKTISCLMAIAGLVRCMWLLFFY